MLRFVAYVITPVKDDECVSIGISIGTKSDLLQIAEKQSALFAFPHAPMNKDGTAFGAWHELTVYLMLAQMRAGVEWTRESGEGRGQDKTGREGKNTEKEHEPVTPI